MRLISCIFMNWISLDDPISLFNNYLFLLSSLNVFFTLFQPITSPDNKYERNETLSPTNNSPTLSSRSYNAIGSIDRVLLLIRNRVHANASPELASSNRCLI